MDFQVGGVRQSNFRVGGDSQAPANRTARIVAQPNIPQQASVAAPNFAQHQATPINVGLQPGSFADLSQQYHQVSLGIDPNTRAIQFKAPQYYLDSDEFKTQVQPALKRLEGKDLTDNEVQAILSSDMLKNIQGQAGAVRQRTEAIEQYKRESPKASNEDAMVYLRNMSAQYASDGDKDTQIIYSIDKKGKQKTASVSEVVSIFKNWDDTSKSNFIKNQEDIISGKDFTEAQKAAAKGVLAFADGKGLLDASSSTRVKAFLTGALSASDNSGVGWLANQITRIGNDGTAAQSAQADLDKGYYQRLQADSAIGAGQFTSDIFGLGADVVASIPVGGAAAAGGRVLVKLGNMDRSLDAIRAAKGGQTGLRLGREGVENLAFGAAQTATNDDYDFNSNFLLDTAVSAGALGAGRLIKQGVQSLEGNAYVKAVSDVARSGIYRTIELAHKIPFVANKLKSGATNILSSSASVERAARNALGRGKITENQYMDIINKTKASVNGAGAIMNDYIQTSPTFRRLYDYSNEVSRMGEDARKGAIDYTTNRMVLDNIEAGRYNATKQQREQVEAIIEKTRSPEAERYYADTVAFNDEVTKWGTDNGLLNEQLIEYMRNSPEFADNYIHLQFDNLKNSEYTGFTQSNRSQNSKRLMKRIKGLTDREAVDPLLTGVDRLQAMMNLKVQNELLVTLKNLGLADVVQDASVNARKAGIQAAITAERATVARAINNFDGEINRIFGTGIIDDLEDPLGKGAETMRRFVDGLLDDMSDHILQDPQFRNTVLANTDLAGVTDLDIVNEALSINRQAVLDSVEKASKQAGELTQDGQRQLLEMVSDSIDSRIGDNVSSGLADKRAEIKRINESFDDSRTAAGTDETATYFENGGSGKLAFSDPEVKDYFLSNKSRAETHAFTNVLINASRSFRAGTTSLNPIFNFIVNPVRDVTRSAVTAGSAVVTPRNVMRDLLAGTGMNTQAAEEFLNMAERTRRNSMFNSTSSTFARSDPQRSLQFDQLKDLDRQWTAKEGGLGTKAKVHIMDLGSPRKMLRKLEDINNAVDLHGIRKNTFDGVLAQSLRNGMSADDALTRAIFYADEASTSFWRAGEKTRSLFRTIPYMSAAVNGLASFQRLWALDPLGVTARITAGFIMPITYLTINNLQNENYANIPDYVKDTNIIIMRPDGSYIKIPIDYELAKVTNPFREIVEGVHDGDLDAFQVFSDAIINSSPVDLGGFTERDISGGVDYARAATRAVASVVPQGVRGVYEAATGTDLYTGGALGLTDQEIYERGLVAPGQEITNADRTFATRNSFILGKVANFLGVPQSTIQSVVSNFSGQVGEFILNGLDKAFTDDPSQQGGRDISQTALSRIEGDATTGGRAQTEYYRGVDRLEREKELLQTQLSRVGEDSATRQRLIDEYGEKVATFVRTYQDEFEDLGGLLPYQLNNMVRLLNLSGETRGVFSQGSYQNANASDLYGMAQNDATRRALDLGLPGTNQQSVFGSTELDHEGNPVVDYGNSSLYGSVMRDTVYGAPKQITYEANQLMKADKATGRLSMYDEQQKYYSQLNKLYDAAKGLKGAAATEAYAAISAKQEEYMTKVFDARIKPLVDKYGVSILRNSTIADEIAKYVMVPSDFTPFVSRKKQPYQKDDAFAYLKDRYGVGSINRVNLPSDEGALAIIKAANQALDSGNTQSAKMRLQELLEDINSGMTYVDQDNLDTIRQLIKAANSR